MEATNIYNLLKCKSTLVPFSNISEFENLVLPSNYTSSIVNNNSEHLWLTYFCLFVGIASFVSNLGIVRVSLFRTLWVRPFSKFCITTAICDIIYTISICLMLSFPNILSFHEDLIPYLYCVGSWGMQI